MRKGFGVHLEMIPPMRASVIVADFVLTVLTVSYVSPLLVSYPCCCFQR